MNKDDELQRNRLARIPREKKPKAALRRKSPKKQAQEAAEKKLVSSDGDTLKEQWFKARRKEMVGTCQCGCGNKSEKKSDIYFRCSIAHIFPKGKDASGKIKFPSVMYHPLNWVERAFFGGRDPLCYSPCHTLMDDTSMDRWVNFADWDDIKAKFYILAPLLTPEEKATKFYQHLEKLVYGN